MPDVTFDDLLARARAEPRVLGVFLGGSRGKGANVRPDSDYDVRVVIEQGNEQLARSFATPRGRPVEVVVMTVDELRDLPEWDRYTLAHTKALVDKTGEVQRLIDEKGTLRLEEADPRARSALDAYMNSLYRSLKRPGLARRIHAAESIGHVLACLFALERRVRPYHDYLAWELEHYPLPGWAEDELLGRLERVLGGDPDEQRAFFRRVERHVRARGLGDVVDGWEPHVAFMRGATS